jgi:hypothetical protein
MNASHRLFVIAPANLRLAGLAACAGLSACAIDNPLKVAPIDASSPIAAEASRMAHETKAFPTFAQIPPEPTDVRPVRAWGRAAKDVDLAGAKLIAETGPSTWTLDSTETFAATARRQAGAPASAESTTAATEAYAKELRKRATPPPPPKR